MSDLDDEELLKALDVDTEPALTSRYTPREERLIAGFEDILRFYHAQGRAPLHGEDRDIFERLYAVRLDRLRDLPEARELLAPMDTAGLLQVHAPPVAQDLDDDTLLEQLFSERTDDITQLRHVPSAERRAAEEVATRERCVDFSAFAPLFAAVQLDLKSGQRKAVMLEKRSLAEIQKGTFFIVEGQIAYVADVEQSFTTPYERRDRRLRVIYDNGTESDVLQRSFQRALHRDDIARVISDPHAGPLFDPATLPLGPAAVAEPTFGDASEPDDLASGTIYVLRSLSDDPFVAKHREIIHKIGVTGETVEARVARAARNSTYLLSDVEVVATYQLANASRTHLEKLFHRVFAGARLDVTIKDRFGYPVRPREWFMVPLDVIDEVVQCIRDGSIVGLVYDARRARLVEADSC